jgi:hypothetical protein
MTAIKRSKTFETEMHQRGYSAAENWVRRGKNKPKTRPIPPVFDEKNLKIWFEGWDQFWDNYKGI